MAKADMYLKVEGTGLELHVGGQSLRGGFAFERTSSVSGTTVVTITVTNAELRLGDGTTDFLVATANGTVTMTRTSATKTLTGSVQASIQLNVPSRPIS